MGERLTGLDALRGIAALIVAVLHLGITYGLDWQLLERAYLAVDLFFVMSGFILARIYERDGFRHSVAEFFKIRFVRLWPPMAVGAALSAVFLAVKGIAPSTIAAIVLPLFLLLPNPLTRGTQFGKFPINMPAWSIFAELIANVLHAALLWRLSNRWLGAVVIAAIVATQLNSPGLELTVQDGLYKSIPRVIAGYGIGVLVYRMGLETKLPAWLALAGLPALTIALSFVPAYADLAFLALCPVFVLASLNLSGFERIAGIAGALSFPLYAVHTPVMVLSVWAGLSPATAFLLALAASALVAVLVDRRILRFIPPLRKRARVS